MDLRVLNNSRCFLFSLIFLIAGCESSKSPVEGKSAEEVYLEAGDLLKNEDFEDAGKKFKDIETYFPYSEKARTAQLMTAYCDFRNSNYIDSVRELDVFLRYHPTHKLVPYAMYLRAMSKYMTVSTAGRDVEQAKESRSAFVELINKFPSCKYAEDAKKKIIVLDDIIAAHELIIGRYYQKNKNNLSAIRRYGYIVSRYPNTKSAEESFYRMIECFRNEELMEEANNAASVLKVRYPNGRWTSKLDALQ